MASSKQVLLLATVATVACLASLASATDWMVGEEGGWRDKFNETGWANGKTFRVGDRLVFIYPKENYTVAQVGKDDFASCNLQGNQLGIWNSGHDVVTLDKPGKVWFISTKPNQCDNGMKLAIDVVGDSAPAPAPFPFPIPIPIWGPAPAPAKAPIQPWPQAPPPSGAVRYPVGGAVAVAAAAVVAAALAF